jgi:hypothetical protein
LNSPQGKTPFRRLRRRIYGDVSLCLLILIGCSNGDFGRVRSSLVTDGIHNWVGRHAARGVGAPISQFPLTDDEILLRDYAYQLIEPPYDRQRWYSVLGVESATPGAGTVPPPARCGRPRPIRSPAPARGS